MTTTLSPWIRDYSPLRLGESKAGQQTDPNSDLSRQMRVPVLPIREEGMKRCTDDYLRNCQDSKVATVRVAIQMGACCVTMVLVLVFLMMGGFLTLLWMRHVLAFAMPLFPIDTATGSLPRLSRRIQIW